MNLFVLVIACFQAFKARNIQTEFSEATYIGLAMFTLAQAYLSGIPIVVVVREIPAAFYLVLTFLIFLLCMAIIVFIFLPKISLQNKYKQMPPQEQQEMMASKLKKSVRGSGISGSSLQVQGGSGQSREKPGSGGSTDTPGDEDNEFAKAKIQIEMSESSLNQEQILSI